MASWIRSFWNDIRPSIYWTLIVWVGTGGVLGQVTKALLVTFTRIPHVWITPIWLLATAIFGALGMLLLGKITRKPSQLKQKNTGLVKTDVVNLAVADDFYRHQDHRLTEELEAEIRKSIVNLRGDEREQTLIRILISVMWGLMFANTWTVIYGSQIKALISLNRGPASRSDVEAYYRMAAAANPRLYANYTFDSWLAFLISSFLVREQDGQVFITIRGQAFLKTMIQGGSSESDRPY